MNVWKYTFVVTALSLLASTASAATYTFDLQIGGDSAVQSGNSLAVTEGDLTAEFTGKFATGLTFGFDDTISASSFSDATSLDRHYNGLGICNDGPCYTDDPFHTVDGLSDNLNDYVEMSFSSGGDEAEVELIGLVFGWVGYFTEGGYTLGYSGSDGMFDIVLDTAGLAGIDGGDLAAYPDGLAVPVPALPGWGTAEVDLTGDGLIDSVFGVFAGDLGSWKLKSVIVEYNVPEVPVPAAIWLMLGGLGGLAAMRRRR